MVLAVIGCSFWSTTGLLFRWKGDVGLLACIWGTGEVKIPVVLSPTPKCNLENLDSGLSPVKRVAL